MLPARGELLHFSEDPFIEEFLPHVAVTARQPDAYVWTVDALNSPCYWFPRQCPRVCHWEGSGRRVHAIESAWLATMSVTTVFAYRFAATDFEPFGERPHAFVSTRRVQPLAPPLPVTDLPGLHETHGIDLLVLDRLEEHAEAVRVAGHDFSAIRMRNALLGPGAFPS